MKSGKDGGQFPIYNVDALKNATQIVIAEGEKDCDTLLANGITTISFPHGADTVKEEYISPLLPLKMVYIAYDNDPAGENGRDKIITLLKMNGFSGQIFVVQWIDKTPGYDVTDWFNEVTDPNKADSFFKLFQEYLLNDVSVRKAIGPHPADTRSEQHLPILQKEAFYGVFGEYINAIADFIEPAPVGPLVQMLSCFSNVVGSGPYYKIGATIHKLNIFTVIVGRTAKSRKGTGWDIARDVMKLVDYQWWDNKIKTGLSSGEGLIVEVRDPEPDSNDPGKLDKRLFIFEPEFSKVLKVSARSLNILADIIRQAWDTGKLNIMNKNDPVKASNAFISINGHITAFELRQLLSDVDIFNGFGNRFLWFYVKRANVRPFGDDYENFDPTPYIERIKKAVVYAKTVGRIQLDAEACELWEPIYNELADETSEEGNGLSDELTARAEPQLVRLACIYALSDLSDVIKPSHIKAAMALWKYSEDSVKCIFGDCRSNSTAEKIKNGLKNSPTGLTRSEIFALLGRNPPKVAIDAAFDELLKVGLVICKKTETGGRPEERWFYVGK